MPSKFIIESFGRIDETAHITGIALIPRISRNENLYTKAELARFNGMTVPLNWEHDSNINIGSVTFQYNPELETVYYEGQITDEKYASLAKNKTLFTSIEASVTSNQKICNGPDDCFNMPFGLQPEALALTEIPGVPETSVKLLESYIQKAKETKEDHNIEYNELKSRLEKTEQALHNMTHCKNCGGIKKTSV